MGAFGSALEALALLVVQDEYVDDPIDNSAGDIDGPLSLFSDGFEGGVL